MLLRRVWSGVVACGLLSMNCASPTCRFDVPLRFLASVWLYTLSCPFSMLPLDTSPQLRHFPWSLRTFCLWETQLHGRPRSFRSSQGLGIGWPTIAAAFNARPHTNGKSPCFQTLCSTRRSPYGWCWDGSRLLPKLPEMWTKFFRAKVVLFYVSILVIRTNLHFGGLGERTSTVAAIGAYGGEAQRLSQGDC